MTSFLTPKTKKILEPYLYVMPAVIVVVGILGYGVVFGTFMSLFRVDLRYADAPFVGLQNYATLFRSSEFRNSLQRTLLFVSGSVGLGIVAALTFALSIFAARRFSRFFQALTLVPFLVSGIATAIIFRFLFGGSAGIINHILSWIGLDTIYFLAHPHLALLVTVLARVWTIFPLATLLLHAGLLSIDLDLFDAARADGASPPYVLFGIILPLIAPMIGVSLMWLSFASFNVFDIPLALTGGGPGRATEVLAVYMYNTGFRQLQYSLGSAVMVVILSLNLLVSVALLKFFK